MFLRAWRRYIHWGHNSTKKFRKLFYAPLSNMAFKCSSSMLHVDYRITISLTYKKQNEYLILKYILVTFSCKASRYDLASSLRVSFIAEPNFWINLYCRVNDGHIKEFNFSSLKLLSLKIVDSKISVWTKSGQRFLSFVQTSSRLESGFDLVQTKSRYESGH